jgi:magnesium-transporting ATPase (P-type)
VAEIEECIREMAKRSLRTLCLAHKDYISIDALPDGWQDNNPPDGDGLCCDCVVGIIDPLRSDVKEAVRTAQRAGEQTRLLLLEHRWSRSRNVL